MLRATAGWLITAQPGVTADPTWNAYVESFGIHARALGDFLANRGRHSDDVLAKHYAPGWTAEDPALAIAEVVDKQVAHLTSVRLDKTPINPWEVLTQLNQSFGRFILAVPDDDSASLVLEGSPEPARPRPAPTPTRPTAGRDAPLGSTDRPRGGGCAGGWRRGSHAVVSKPGCGCAGGWRRESHAVASKPGCRLSAARSRPVRPGSRPPVITSRSACRCQPCPINHAKARSCWGPVRHGVVRLNAGRCRGRLRC